MCVIFYWKKKVKTIDENINVTEVTATDYAVLVTGLPKDATHKEILNFFNGLYALDKTAINKRERYVVDHEARTLGVLVDPKHPELSKGPTKDKPQTRFTHRYLKGRVITEPVEFEKVDFGPYKDKWIAEVSIIHPNGSAIRHYLNQIDLMNKLRKARARVKMESETDTTGKRVKKALKNLASIQKHLDDVIKKISSHEDDTTCIGAIILFNNEESRNRCLTVYIIL